MVGADKGYDKQDFVLACREWSAQPALGEIDAGVYNLVRMAKSLDVLNFNQSRALFQGGVRLFPVLVNANSR
jgi:hypothetical protein